MEDDMMERLLALVLAGTLVAPQIGRASQSELNNGRARQASSKFPEQLPLPPIPYLETMPWMNFGSQPKGPGIDTLLRPEFSIPAEGHAFAIDNALNTRQVLAGTGIK
jgi:hypothetical protein